MKDSGRSRRQEEQAVAESDCVVEIVGDQQRHHLPAGDQRGDLVAQPSRKCIVELGQRLVEDEEIRFNGEGAGERDAAGEAERQLTGKVVAVHAQFEHLEQR